MSDDILFDLFHNCALIAFVEQANAQQGWPDCEATRLRAFSHFERVLPKERKDRGPTTQSVAETQP